MGQRTGHRRPRRDNFGSLVEAGSAKVRALANPIDPIPEQAPRIGLRAYLPTLLVVPVIAALDQLSKAFMADLLDGRPGQALWIIEPLLRLRLVHNDGIVFGIFSGALSSWVTILFVLAALAAVIAIFLRYLRQPTLLARIVLGCIIGGAVGNLIDRFRLGHVVDFVDLGWWPVFNVADSAINISMVVLVVLVMFGKLERDPQAVPPTA